MKKITKKEIKKLVEEIQGCNDLRSFYVYTINNKMGLTCEFEGMSQEVIYNKLYTLCSDNLVEFFNNTEYSKKTIIDIIYDEVIYLSKEGQE
jgi:hypothetical protein